LARGVVAVDGLDFRVQVLAVVRAAGQRGRLGNRVGPLIVPLPISEPDRARRHLAGVRATRALKGSKQVRGSELLESLGDWTTQELLAGLLRRTSEGLAFNMTVSIVTGQPDSALHLQAQIPAAYLGVYLYAHQ